MQKQDPSGLFIGGAFGFAAGATDPAGVVGAALESMVGQYVANMNWDVEWATDWSMPDNIHTRGNNDWVNLSLLSGGRSHI